MVVAALVAPLGRRILTSIARARQPRELRFAVAAYMAVISAMLATALATGNVLAAAGAVLFVASDSMIAWDRFVRPFAWAPVAIMVTYHLGQAGLVASLLHARSCPVRLSAAADAWPAVSHWVLRKPPDRADPRSVIDLDAVSRAAGCFEPLPTSAIRLAALVANDIPDVARIVEVVRYDQALTAALLRRANSSWSASRTEITTVKDAVVRIGAGPVVALALGVNVRDRLSAPIPAYGLEEGELWNHSVAATLAAESLMRAAKRHVPTETPTAALLHDVGKLVMARFVDPADLIAIEAARSPAPPGCRPRPRCSASITPSSAGWSRVAWRLPDSLVAGIEHTPRAEGPGPPRLGRAHRLRRAPRRRGRQGGRRGSRRQRRGRDLRPGDGRARLTPTTTTTVCRHVQERFAESRPDTPDLVQWYHGRARRTWSR